MSPIDGEIISFNYAMMDAKRKLGANPEDKGIFWTNPLDSWLVRMRSSNELKEYLTLHEYHNLFKNT